VVKYYLIYYGEDPFLIFLGVLTAAAGPNFLKKSFNLSKSISSFSAILKTDFGNNDFGVVALPRLSEDSDIIWHIEASLFNLDF